MLARTDGSHEPTGRYRVIVADDDEEIRCELVRLLSATYDLVAVVENGRDLVAIARDLQPHLIIVDVSMPHLNGFDAVKQMRLDGVESKVVFFTTTGNPLYVRKALSLGATGYVVKALGNEELITAVQTVLSGGTFVSPSIGPLV